VGSGNKVPLEKFTANKAINYFTLYTCIGYLKNSPYLKNFGLPLKYTASLPFYTWTP